MTNWVFLYYMLHIILLNILHCEEYVLKKLLLKIVFIVASLLILPSRDSLSNVYTDLMGVYNNAGDAKTQYGYGFLLGVDFDKDFSFLIKGIITSLSENNNDPNEGKYSHMMLLGGIGYGYTVPAYRLMWRSSLLFGYSSTDVEKSENYVKNSNNDDGVSFEITTGIQWNATQHLAPFFDIGYHRSYYIGGLQDASISGFQAMLGLRFYLFNVKRIDEGY